MPKVLGITLYGFDIPTISASIINDVFGSPTENRLISATGAHGLVEATINKSFYNILSEFYCNLPDGTPGVWIGRAKGARKMETCSGPNFFKYLMINTADKPVRHFFCGGKEGVADKLKESCAVKFNNHNIVGTYCPPFREMTDTEMAELGKLIMDSKADIVWIGLSTPKQEFFSYRLRNFISTHYIISVGAAFDFHTGIVKEAPKWLQNTGLEWLYRLTKEPKRLYKRYLIVVPFFIYYNIKELINKLKIH